MSLSPEQLRFIAEYTASIIGKINQVLANRITTTFTNSNDVIPSSKLVKDEFAAVRSEIPTNTSDLTNDGADGTHAFIVEGDSRLDDTRNPKPHNQASSTITDTNTYSNIGNTLQNQASINSAINEKIGALMNLDIIEQVTTRPTASADTLNKIYAVPENDPTSENLFQYFITVYENNAYKWDKIDIAQVDISGKVDKVEGKQLSTEDYTTAEKTKLELIEPKANKTIVDPVFINNSTNPVQSKAIQDSLNLKANIQDLSPLAFSGDYNDLTNTSNIIEKSVTSGLIKNDGTIDTNQYLTSDNVPESFNYGYVDSNLVLHLICVDGEVTATNSIIQSGDSNTITAVITDKDNNPLEGIPVEFLFNGVKQGQTINSNANGIATYNYSGIGAGEVDVQVRVGSFLSETYGVLDALFLDTNTNHNTKWWKSQSSASITTDTDGIIFSSENVGSTTYSRNLCYITDSFPTIWADQEEACKFLTSSFCFEFDIVDVLNSTQIIINFTGGAKSVLNISNGDKIKLVYDGSYLTFYKNSEVYERVAFTFADNKTWIGFNIFGGYKIKLNNLRVYPI